MGASWTPADDKVISAIEREQVTRADVIRGLLDAVAAASNAGELVAAWRELGKIIGAYEPERVVMTTEVMTPVHLRALSDLALLKLLGTEDIVVGEPTETLLLAE